MKIVEIRSRRKHLCALVLDEEFDYKSIDSLVDSVGLLTVDSELLELKGITAGQEIAWQELECLIKESNIKRAKSRAMWYISRQDMPKEKLRRKLLVSFPEYAANIAVDRVVELGFINDLEYAKRRLQLIITSKKVSLKAAVRLLEADGVSRDTVSAVVEDYQSEYNPTDMILELVNRKYKDKLADKKDFEKTVAALMRKGFSYGEIRTALNSLQDEWNDF